MTRNSNGIYQFALFQQFPGLVHGFSTRQFGDMSYENILEKDILSVFTNVLTLENDSIIFMEQTHSNTVTFVPDFNKKSYIKAVDGIATDVTNMFAVVRTADCVPLLFFDPQSGITGVSHAGWKGALSGIATNMIEMMIKKGARSDSIRVGIGPSIRNCCYQIDKERVMLFRNAFPHWEKEIFLQKNDATYVSLQKLVQLQLISIGVKHEHIEDSEICTRDSIEEFFSFRGKDTMPFGLFGGIIGRMHV